MSKKAPIIDERYLRMNITAAIERIDHLDIHHKKLGAITTKLE